MRTIQLGPTSLEVPVVAVGCMRLHALERREAERFVRTAVDEGATFFDHADIYGGGASEERFAEAIAGEPGLRDRIVLQSKCGIREGRYDASKEHIVAAVEGILRRLRTDRLDVLLLHRPDALVEPDEVAEAFDTLEREGKVLHFGVSNHHPGQIELLRRSVRQPLVTNQLQLSLMHAAAIASGMHVNMRDDAAVDRDGAVLDYCRRQRLTVQPWSPFQSGTEHGVFVGNEAFPELNGTLEAIAADRGVSATTVALAWLLRHPANMQPVVGTTRTTRLRECLAAADVRLSREEWYALYRAAGHTLP